MTGLSNDTRLLVLELLRRERDTLAFIRNPAPAHRDQLRRVERAIGELTGLTLGV